MYTWQVRTNLSSNWVARSGYCLLPAFPGYLPSVWLLYCCSGHVEWSKNQNSVLRTKMLFIKWWISASHEVIPFLVCRQSSEQPPSSALSVPLYLGTFENSSSLWVLLLHWVIHNHKRSQSCVGKKGLLLKGK